MDKLWAPWREKYITALDGQSKGCVFCKILRQKKDRENYIFIRGKHCFAVLNLYPYNNGHSLIVPYKHVGESEKLSREEKIELWELIEATKKLLNSILRPQGYNVGMNLGRVAGAGFPGHLHIHIVPRWVGDMNFMPVVASTKVVSQSLAVLHGRLKNAYQK